MFVRFSLYTRKDVWKILHPEGTPYPNGGDFLTGYTSFGSTLTVFSTIGVSGRTGDDYENEYFPDTETLRWYGKNGSHSKQPNIAGIIDASIEPHIFVRWDDKPTFTYLGVGKVLEYENGATTKKGTAIQFLFQMEDPSSGIAEDGVQEVSGGDPPSYGRRISAVVNRYERDPEYRRKCLEHYGYDCQICGFSFKDVYGELGDKFCHVHHIEPVSETGGEVITDPTQDLIPVCPNCHAMLHRQRPAMKPDELRKLLRDKSAEKS